MPRTQVANPSPANAHTDAPQLGMLDEAAQRIAKAVDRIEELIAQSHERADAVFGANPTADTKAAGPSPASGALGRMFQEIENLENTLQPLTWATERFIGLACPLG
jgi:hypothetical protein